MKNISKLFLNGKDLEFIEYFSIVDTFLNTFLTVLIGILFITKYINQNHSNIFPFLLSYISSNMGT